MVINELPFSRRVFDRKRATAGRLIAASAWPRALPAAASEPAAMRVVYGSGMKYDATVPTERTITTM
jgi:hypothetical protein